MRVAARHEARRIAADIAKAAGLLIRRRCARPTVTLVLQQKQSHVSKSWYWRSG
jgi:hypothetical protein